MPFQTCTNNELIKILGNHLSKNDIQNKVHGINIYLLKQLPFFGCSDYAVMQEYLSSKDKYLKYFENNGFTSACNSLLEDFYSENYSCKYYNEDRFNNVIKNIKQILPKYFI